MNTKQLAGVLLLGHLLSVVIVSIVLYKQHRILKDNPSPELHTGRMILLAFAVIILLGNIIPIAIDGAVIFGNIARNRPSGFGVAYSLSNSITALCSAGALLSLYVIAEKLLNNGQSR